ncbi:MAG TPA: MFS transporter [Anaerolinea sp.]|nr:MFS transporter [Anaerolinea sp.]
MQSQTSSTGNGASRLPLTGPARLLFGTRLARMFAYGFLSIVLVLYLVQAGFNEAQIGLMLTLTLVGDTLISLWLTTSADRMGRKRTLLIGAGLMLLAALLFATSRNFFVLLLAATIGVISPSGNEVGPFLSIEQAALSQLVSNERRTGVFAWYNLVGSFATALGAFAGGGISQLLQNNGMAPLTSYRWVVLGYGLFGLILALLFSRMGTEIEAPQAARSAEAKPFFGLGLGKSRKVILRLSALFSLDAFGGGFVVQSFVAYWFHLRFGVDPGVLGAIFLGANLLAGVSALSAAWIARKIGLINTMFFTHLPSNILLMLVPFMPTLPLAVGVLLLRFSISQMDVPTRQSYVMAVVEPDERSAAAGVTGVARTTGASLAPLFTGLLLSNPALIALPFVISGGLKIIYDLGLYRSFSAIKPPEEQAKPATQQAG